MHSETTWNDISSKFRCCLQHSFDPTNQQQYLTHCSAEQLEFNRRSPHSRSGDDRDRQQQFSLNTIPMECVIVSCKSSDFSNQLETRIYSADRAARFLNVVGDSKDFHGSSRMSQASRGSGRSKYVSLCLFFFSWFHVFSHHFKYHVCLKK